MNNHNHEERNHHEPFDDSFDIYEKPQRGISGPIAIIVAIFLLLIMVASFVPFSSVKLDPVPNTLSLDDYLPFASNSSIAHAKTIEQAKTLSVNSGIKTVSDRIVRDSNCKSNRVCYAKAIYYTIRDGIEYVNDPVGNDYFKLAGETINTKNGDCDDHAILLSSMLDSIGIQTEFVYVPGHVLIKAKLPGSLKKYQFKKDWVYLDATCKNCEFGEVGLKTYDYLK